MLKNPKFIATRFKPSGLTDAKGESKTTVSATRTPASIQPRPPLAETLPSPIKSGRVRNINDNAATVINASHKPNREIAGIAELIGEIAHQINLISLNAQIEAAGAGPYGRRFAVVAETIKKLADSTTEATAQIQPIVAQMLGQIQGLVQAAEQSLAANMQVLYRMQEIVHEIRLVEDRVAQTHSLAQEIKISAKEQASAQQQLAQSLTELDSLSLHNAESMARQIENSITRITDLAQYITLLLDYSGNQPSA